MFLAEVRYAARQLRKAPGFTVLALMTLALGIGASTSVFTVFDTVVLKPLSYRESGQLVIPWERVKFLGPTMPYTGPSPRHAEFWRTHATAFESLALVLHRGTGIATGSEHASLTGVLVATPNLLQILRVTPASGRDFRPDDAIKGHDKIAILTDPLRQKLFGDEQKVIGKTVRLGDEPLQVIGVLSPHFRFPNASTLNSFQYAQHGGNVTEPSILVPAVIDHAHSFGWNSDYGNWLGIARLKPGVTVREAQAQLNLLQADIVREMPPGERDREANSLLAYVQPMQEAVAGDSRQSLWLLMAAVVGLMLIACVNLANAQLGRAVTRESEAAVRAALGAPPWQLLWSSLAESLLLAIVGGGTGVALAFGGLQLFRRYAPIHLPRMGEISPNGFVLLFSLLLTTGSGILFGLLPALKFLHADPQSALQSSSSRTQGSRSQRQIRRWLIGLQVFACTALLLVTGLFAKSLLHLLTSDKGFNTGKTVIAEVDLNGKDRDADRARFDDAVLAKLRALPGVESAALLSAMPLEGETWIDGVNRPDRPLPKTPLANLRWVSPGYFETIRDRLVAGRLLEERDRATNGVVISEATAHAAWPGENPIGGHLRSQDKTYTVVGVVADARNNSLKLPPANMIYLHYADNPPYATFFLARGAQNPAELATSVRQAIWKQNPGVTIARIKTLDSQVADSLAPERFQTTVLLTFGVAALLLAMLGIYGVLSYSVAGRHREIGVRMALGATRESIYSLTVSEAALPVFAGLLGGWAASILVGRFIASLLYGVGAMDGSVSALVGLLFLFAAALAAFLPARRAASIEPMAALRAE